MATTYPRATLTTLSIYHRKHRAKASGSSAANMLSLKALEGSSLIRIKRALSGVNGGGVNLPLGHKVAIGVVDEQQVILAGLQSHEFSSSRGVDPE